MIYHASGDQGSATLDHLKRFFFAGVDPRTALPTNGDAVDVETQALISLSDAEMSHYH